MSTGAAQLFFLIHQCFFVGNKEPLNQPTCVSGVSNTGIGKTNVQPETATTQHNNKNEVEDKYFDITCDQSDNVILQHIGYFDVIDNDRACLSTKGIKKSLFRHVIVLG